MKRVLVVDDEPQIVRMLDAYLRRADYEVVPARSGEEALQQAAERVPDIVILDLGLPDLNGTEVIARLRQWSTVPVIVLSGHDEQAKKVAALDAGADDYVTKPFDFDELGARMRAAMRRALPVDASRPVLKYNELEIDLNRRLVRTEGESIHLTPTEYSLLEAMATNPGKLLPHRWLLQRVWGPAYGEESHYLRVYVGQLRQKLRDEAARPRYIATEPGVGYRWVAEPDVQRVQQRQP